MALIIILSVLNGFNQVAISLFNVFDAPFLIEATEGKTFRLKDFPEKEIKATEGITFFIPCAQENALVSYRDNQRIATLKGVGNGYEEMSGIENYICKGEYLLCDDGISFAVLGSEIDYSMGIALKTGNAPLKVYIPKRKQNFGLHAEEAFNTGALAPVGVFMVSGDIDDRYILTDINFVRSLLDYEKDEVTSVELGISPKIKNTDKLQQKIKNIVGDKFSVKNRLEQQALFHETVKFEKIAIYLIMSFIIFIAMFNIISSLSLLILDKKKDIKTLQSMGANKQFIHRIFLTEGMLISLIGAIIGLFLGGVVCWIQQQFGVISMGENFVVDAYPVKLKLLDFALVLFSVMIIGFISVGYTVKSRIRIH